MHLGQTTYLVKLSGSKTRNWRTMYNEVGNIAIPPPSNAHQLDGYSKLYGTVGENATTMPGHCHLRGKHLARLKENTTTIEEWN